MDAITIQILRNKIGSLVDEMHYHFYRSGYSTIIRESRDFSCVILDPKGRLIVAPPMFFHAPVYRYLVGRILELYDGTSGPTAIEPGDVFVSNHPYEGGLPHVSDMAFVAPIFADDRVGACPGAPDNSVGACPGAPDNSVGACPGAPDNSVGACPGAPDNSVGACPGAPDNSVGACPGAPDNSVGACPGAATKRRIIAFAGTIAHKADVGGTIPGSTSANATEIFQEGLLLPPIKIRSRGQVLPDIERLILANTRQPTLVKGDVGAQIAVTEMGAARVAELSERFGASTLLDAFAAILKGAGDELANRIAKLPPGTAEAHGFIDSDGVDFSKPVKLAVKIDIAGGRAKFDFSGSDPQAKGPVNLRPSMIEACVFYSLIGSLGPDLAFNDGMRDCVDIVLAPRTITNAEAPSAVSNYQMVNLKLVDVILQAMSTLAPRRATAGSGSSSAMGIIWSKPRPGQTNMQYEIIGSAYGGSTERDGASGTAAHLSNLHITPIEILESEFPCRIRRFEMLPGSGGAGRHRGGLSMVREYELLEDASVIRRFDKSKFPPNGLAGGEPGGRARFVTNAGTPDEKESPPGRYEMKAGTRFILQSAGGGGFGPPSDRPADAIASDLAEGYAKP